MSLLFRQFKPIGKTLLTSWQRLAAPPRPANLYALSHRERDRWRRGHLLSSIIFGLLACDLLTLLAVLANPIDAGLIAIAGIVFMLSAWLNHRGYVNLAGMLIVPVMGFVIDGATTFDSIHTHLGLSQLNWVTVMLWVGVLYISWLILSTGWMLVVTAICFVSVLAMLFLLPHNPALYGEVYAYIGPMSSIEATLYILVHPIVMCAFIMLGGIRDRAIRAEMAREADEQGAIAERRAALLAHEQTLAAYQQQILTWLEGTVTALFNHTPFPVLPTVAPDLQGTLGQLERGIVPLIEVAMKRAEAQRLQLQVAERNYHSLTESVQLMTERMRMETFTMQGWLWPQALTDPTKNNTLTAAVADLGEPTPEGAKLHTEVLQLHAALIAFCRGMQEQMRSVEQIRENYAQDYIAAIGQMRRGETVQLPAQATPQYKQAALGPLKDMGYAVSSLLKASPACTS